MNTVLLLRKISGLLPKYRRFLSSIAFLLGCNAGLLRCRRSAQLSNKGFCRKCKISACGMHNQIIIEDGAYLEGCSFHIEGSNCKVLISTGCTLIGVEFWIEDDAGEIRIGKAVKTFGDSQFSVIEGQSIVIGDECLLAKGIQIRVGDSHSILSLENHERINHSQSVVIGKHVWIGEKSTVLKGAVIEHDAVIATGAVVTRRVPPNTIAAGVPAKTVKENITWDIQRKN